MKSTSVILWFGLAVLAGFTLAASGPQCARSRDVVTEPGLGPQSSPDPIKVCERDCDAAARVETRQENKRHRDSLKACNGDLGCEAEENALHESLIAEIAADHASCVLDCEHQQGTGTGGQ